MALYSLSNLGNISLFSVSLLLVGRSFKFTFFLCRLLAVGGIDIGELDIVVELDVSGLDVIELDVSGLDVVELDVSGSDVVELDVSGLDVVKLDVSGLDMIELDVSGLDVVELDVGGLDVNSLEDSESGAATISQSSNLGLFLPEVLSFLDRLLRRS